MLAPDLPNLPSATIEDEERISRFAADAMALANVSQHCPQLASALGARDSRGRVLRAVASASDHLSNILLHNPEFALRCFSETPQTLLAEISRELQSSLPNLTAAEFWAALRHARAKSVLAISLASLSGSLDIESEIASLSSLAESLLSAAMHWLFAEAVAEEKLVLTPEQTQSGSGSGYTILGMGKLGALELNYSSDIDLIALYDPETPALAKNVEPSVFYVRLTRRLAACLQDVTGDGFVYRVDLRLRPDPRATQAAIAIEAAALYYENMGQNWERAAMIKARPVAGDIELGREFLDRLKPYIWRKYLDFAAIADIQSLKRQIHAVKGHGQVKIAGHNVKLGRGGIREIEFFVQTQQLIAGGRNAALRGNSTLAMLAALAEHGWISDETARELQAAYRLLRRVENRLQMLDDQQVHELPSDSERLERFARWCGFDSLAEFETALTDTFHAVQGHYNALFEDAGELGTSEGSLVFTGGDDDPETLETLARLGFKRTQDLAATVRSWHFGRYNATRSGKSRARLTELMPDLLSSLARTADPDAAFIAFDRFLAGLPTGVQLFSMLRAHPQLLDLLASILGTAPRLAEELMSRPRLLDAVIDPTYFEILPTREEMSAAFASFNLPHATFEDRLDHARIVGREMTFRTGVRVLSESVSPSEAGEAFSGIADCLIGWLLKTVSNELEKRHGKVAGGACAVLAMGKLGGREMTAASDLDLIVIYDHDEEATGSDGEKPLSASQYYARLTQRLIAALAAPTAEGVLYEVDMRLRPSGNQGPVATRLSSLIEYHRGSAWTWEKLALTRARVVAGHEALAEKVNAAIVDAVAAPRDREKTLSDVAEMRARMFAEHGRTAGPWNIKHVRGGLVDVEFIVQGLQIAHASENRKVLNTNTAQALVNLEREGLLDRASFERLAGANALYHRLTQVLRLCVSGDFSPESAPHGLARLVANAAAAPDLASAEALLVESQVAVARLFGELISNTM